MTTAPALFPEVEEKLRPWAFAKVVRERGTIDHALRTIKGPDDAHRLLQARADEETVEVFYVVALSSQSQVLAVFELSRGILNSSLVHPREVFRVAILAGAAGIIVAHNHPSGDPTPSADDRAVTRQLVDAGRLLDVPVYDHVLLAGDRYVSFAEAGLL
jgi:DNA repair protein RadC